MGVVRIEGKPVTLPDEIINAGVPAIRMALSPDFPDVENADIQIERPARVGAPVTATVVKRGTGKGQVDSLSFAQRDVLAILEAAPEYINPAIVLSVEVLRREAQGDTRFFDDAVRSGRVERAEAAGEREGRAVQQALTVCSGCQPEASAEVPDGF
jgi:hypothetical protein